MYQKFEKKLINKALPLGGDKSSDGAPETKQKGYVHMHADFLPVLPTKAIHVDKRLRRGKGGSLESLVQKVETEQAVIRAMTSSGDDGEDEARKEGGPSSTPTLNGEIVTQDNTASAEAAAMSKKDLVSDSQLLHPSMSMDVLAKAKNWEIFNAYRMFRLLTDDLFL